MMEDVPPPMDNTDNTRIAPADDIGRLQLFEDEHRVLALYDRLEKLQIEKALLKGQLSERIDITGTVNTTRDGIKKAQDNLLQSRAAYVVKKEIVEAVVMASPILKAVHNGVTASPIEKDLLPYIKRRDQAAIDLAKASTTIQSTVSESIKVQAETLRISRRNVELTSELLALAEQVKQRNSGQEDTAEMRDQMEDLRKRLKASRQTWKAIKGVAIAVVAGSGVDWASDPNLREVVLDDKG